MREATLHDGPELARLRWDFRPEDQGSQAWGGFSSQFDAWYRSALRSGKWSAAVAESDGMLIGCMFLESVPKVPTPGRIERSWGYVTNSYVESAYRGKGVGSSLLDLIVALGRAREHEFLIVWPSAEALSLYTRAGFREVGTVHAGPDDYPPLELRL